MLPMILLPLSIMLVLFPLVLLAGQRKGRRFAFPQDRVFSGKLLRFAESSELQYFYAFADSASANAPIKPASSPSEAVEMVKPCRYSGEIIRSAIAARSGSINNEPL